MEEYYQSNKDIVDKVAEVGRVVDDLSGELRVLNENFQSFNKSSSVLGNKANSLLWYYVILTGIIAVATVINVIIK